MNRKSTVGLAISALSILLTVAALIALSSLPHYLEYYYEEPGPRTYTYDHGQEEETVLIVNNTLLETSYSIDAYQLRVVSINVSGGPVSISVSASGSQIQYYPSVTDEVLNGTIYPQESYTTSPTEYSFDIEVHGTGDNATISVLYTIGTAEELYYTTTRGPPSARTTDAYYAVLSSGISLLIGGGVTYLLRILYSVALSVELDVLLPIAGLLTPQIILSEVNQYGLHSTSYITSILKFGYGASDISVGSGIGNIVHEGSTSSIINSIGQPLASALVISSLVLILSMWLLFFGNLRPRIVAILALLNVEVIVVIAMRVFQEAPIWGVELVFIPVPILASGALILASMWKRINKNESQ